MTASRLHSISKPVAFRVEVTRHDGSVTLSPRLAFRSIAAHGVRVMGREPGVIGARVVLAA